MKAGKLWSQFFLLHVRCNFKSWLELLQVQKFIRSLKDLKGAYLLNFSSYHRKKNMIGCFWTIKISAKDKNKKRENDHLILSFLSIGIGKIIWLMCIFLILSNILCQWFLAHLLQGVSLGSWPIRNVEWLNWIGWIALPNYRCCITNTIYLINFRN